ncbi:30178_t:CDS:2, partial [Gigaspora margarita]
SRDSNVVSGESGNLPDEIEKISRNKKILDTPELMIQEGQPVNVRDNSTRKDKKPQVSDKDYTNHKPN